MAAVDFDCGDPFEQHPGVTTVRRPDCNRGQVPLRQCSGLVEDHRIYRTCLFERLPVLDEDAKLRAATDTNHYSRG